jgi:hypothetical protein
MKKMALARSVCPPSRRILHLPGGSNGGLHKRNSGARRGLVNPERIGYSGRSRSEA